MKWRTIINMSLTGHRHSALGNAVEGCLKDCHITATTRHSASWEGTPVTPTEAVKQLKTVFDYRADPCASGYRGELHHLLIYIDRARS